MLYQIGPAQIQNGVVHELSLGLKGETRFAEHNVLGGSPVFEFVGQGATTYTISGTLHPEFCGGLEVVEALEAARNQALPMPVVRGDLVPLGWFVITELSHDSSNIGLLGAGREVEFSVTMKRTDAPGTSLAAALFRLF